MKKRRFISIFRKQLLVACLFALLLAMGTSAYQFFNNIGQLKDSADATLQQILRVYTNSIDEQLNIGNLNGARQQLQQIFQFPPVLTITLYDQHQQPLFQLERTPAPAPPSWWQSHLFGPPHSHSFKLGGKTPAAEHWSLDLSVSNALIPSNHSRTLAAILLSNFIVCFLLTLGFYALLHTLVTRQIIALTAQLTRVKEQTNKTIDLKVTPNHQNDEMGLLADTINGLWNTRHELQKSLAEHNAFVTTVTAISPVGLFRTNTQGELIWYNQKSRVLLGILGYEKHLTEWLGNIHPDQQDEVLAAWQQAIEQEQPFHAEFQLCLADHELRWVIGEAIPSWSNGKYEGFVGTLTDVTPLKQATDKLHDSEKRYHTITQTANSAIVLTEANGTISYWNPAAETIFGYSRKQALNENFSALIIPDQSRHTFANACPEFEESAAEHRSHPFELEARTKSGSMVPVEMSLTVFKMEEKWHAAMFISDISKRISSEKERVSLLDQLRQSQKMEAIGTLAGGIAHDFNNILTPILGFAQILQMKFSEGSKEHDRIEKILLSANRAKDLVGQILSFSRKSKEEAQPLLVMPLIKDSLKLLRAGIPSTISIKTRLPSTDFWIQADPTRLNQILMNLVTNAVQAMSDGGGTLSIGLEELSITAHASRNLPAGPYLKLEVKDTGSGIDPYTLERIFDPYFTTKGTESGTGLGLSVVQSSVTSLGGMIEVDSSPGEGATFSVFLPLIRGEFQTSASPLLSFPHGDNQHLLLVDDEMSLINIGREFLEDLGYRVTATTSSREAMEMIEKDPEQFDMLITDQTMPQLTGMQLARQTKKLRPDLPIIVCTGQRSLIDEKDLEQADILTLLDKPDIFNQLATSLQDYFGPNTTPAQPIEQQAELELV